MASGRKNNPVKTGTIVKWVLFLIIAAGLIWFGIRTLQSRVDSSFASDEEDTVESATVTTGSISTTVGGSGTLSYEEAEELTIPSDVEITEYFVEKGDTVAEGDLLATVNTTSLVVAMSSVQDEIAELDEELADVADETIDDEIEATVSGRVKAILISEGDDVASAMYENNALMLLSLDGKMAVDVSTDALAAKDEVSVSVGGSTYDGTVEKVISGVATVTFTDKGPAYGARAEVTKDGESLGSGTIYIHRSLSVTGYAGTVKKIKVSVNEAVDAGDTLMTLTDTSYTANYDSLLSEREDLEDELQDLLTIYKEGAVYAKQSGIITSLNKGTYMASSSSDSSSSTSSSGSSSSSASSSYGSNMMSMYMMGTSASSTESSESDSDDTVFSISPIDTMLISVSIDESDILSLSEGQEAVVTIDSLEDEEFTGTVTEIGTEGTSSNGVTTYTAEVSIPKSENMLSGMSATVTITIEGVENALLIPADALNQTSSTAYVYTSYDEESQTLGDMVEVTIGISNGSYVEITGGLSVGDTVYYKPSSDDSSFPGWGNMGGGMSGDMPSGFGGDSGSGHGNRGGNMPGAQ